MGAEDSIVEVLPGLLVGGSVGAGLLFMLGPSGQGLWGLCVSQPL